MPGHGSAGHPQTRIGWQLHPGIWGPGSGVPWGDGSGVLGLGFLRVLVLDPGFELPQGSGFGVIQGPCSGVVWDPGSGSWLWVPSSTSWLRGPLVPGSRVWGLSGLWFWDPLGVPALGSLWVLALGSQLWVLALGSFGVLILGSLKVLVLGSFGVPALGSGFGALPLGSQMWVLALGPGSGVLSAVSGVPWDPSSGVFLPLAPFRDRERPHFVPHRAPPGLSPPDATWRVTTVSAAGGRPGTLVLNRVA